MSVANLGLWTHDVVQPFGQDESYSRAAQWLSGMKVQDWGCGSCYARKFFDGRLYTGIDGSGPYADVTADLATYHSPRTPGILMRHVLEHCEDWETILMNAIGTYTQRMVIITFLPLFLYVKQYNTPTQYAGIHNSSLPRNVLMTYLWTELDRCERLGHETIFYLSKPGFGGYNGVQPASTDPGK